MGKRYESIYIEFEGVASGVMLTKKSHSRDLEPDPGAKYYAIVVVVWDADLKVTKFIELQYFDCSTQAPLGFVREYFTKLSTEA